jgi:zinc D-Ala-D-Ala carboxypeptidase
MDIARHFTLDELTHSNTAKAEGINNEPGPADVEALRALCAAVLDPLRDKLGKSIVVNCAYRGPVLNKRVGGVANSQHLTGQAADIQAPGVAVVDLFKLIVQQALPYDQIIYEAKSATSKWVHVSHVDGANRGEIRVAKFGPDGKPLSYPLITKEAALAMSEPRTRGPAPALIYEEGEDEPVLPSQPVPMAPTRRKKQPVAEAPTRRLPAKKASAKNVVAAKSAPKKVAANQATAKKAPVKKGPAKTSAAKKPPSKKVAVKAAAAKQAPARKAGRAKAKGG